MFKRIQPNKGTPASVGLDAEHRSCDTEIRSIPRIYK